MEKVPLRPKELGAALMISVTSHFLIRLLDDLKNTNIYRQNLKSKTNSLLIELENHSRETIWLESPEGSDIDDAANQMEIFLDHFQNMLLTSITAGNLPAGQIELFWQDMQMTFKRHKMPLRLTPDGVLEIASISK